MVNRIYNLSRPEYRHNAFAGGLAMTWVLSEKFSLDMDLQVEPGIKKSRIYNKSSHYYLNADAGYYVNDVFQLVGGFSFAHTGPEVDRESANIVKFIPGFALQTGRNFILVGGVPFCIAGRNYDCTNGFLVAFTIIIE